MNKILNTNITVITKFGEYPSTLKDFSKTFDFQIVDKATISQWFVDIVEGNELRCTPKEIFDINLDSPYYLVKDNNNGESFYYNCEDVNSIIETINDSFKQFNEDYLIKRA